MRLTTLARSVFVPLILLTVACVPASQASCPPATASNSIKLAAEPRPDNAVIGLANVELSQPAPVFVEYGNDQSGWLRSPTSAAAATHRVPILRLAPDSTYQVRAFSLDQRSCPTSVASAEFKTGTLPDQLRNVDVQTQGQASFPLMAMDWPSPAPFLPPGAPGDRSRYLAAVEQSGKVIWYYQVPKDYPVPPPEGSAYPILRRANGNLLYIAGYFSVDEITPNGQIVSHFQFDKPGARWPHHDVAELPDGKLLYLGAEDRTIDDSRNGGPRDFVLRGDTLHLLDPKTSAEEQLWNTFDGLDPAIRVPDWSGWKIQGVPDWTHANAMSLGPRGNIIISFRHADQVISLSPDFKTIEWRLGGPGSSFSFPDPSDVFHGQHGVLELPNGHLTMFDNGNYRPGGEYSRALELELNLGSMTARKVWEYRPQPDIFSDKVSNIDRLPNGNTFVNFGWRVAPDEPALAREVKPDGTVLWEQTMRWKGMRAVRYRAYPWESIGGETVVTPTAIGK